MKTSKMSTSLLLCLLCCTLTILTTLPSVTVAANILGLFPHRGKSHFDFFRPILVGLAKAGHQIDVVSYFPNKRPIENYTDYALDGVEIFAEVVDITRFDDALDIDALPLKFKTFFVLHDWGIESCRLAFEHKQLQRVLKSNKKYDLVIMEQFNNDCMMGVAHKLGAPVVALSSCALMPWHYRRMGSPMVHSHMPMSFLPFNEDMNLLDRINNFLHFHVVNAMYDFVTQPATNQIMKEYLGSDIPQIEELVKKTSVMLLNQHYSLAGAFPQMPNIIEVGGVQIQEQKPLDEELQSLLDNSPHKGVIYISWGSMIRPETLPADKQASLFEVIAQFSDYLFLMKWPDQSLKNKPANLVTRSWMPQRDVLCHPKIRAFFTHGGLLGTSEAVYCGVPMLVTPFYGDQFLNSMAISHRKLGIVVKYKNFNRHNLASALTSILAPSFMQTVREVAAVYRNRPVKPLALSIWWIEHVISTRGAPLAQSAAKQLNSFAYNAFDVYLILSGAALIVILIFYALFNLVLSISRHFLGKSKKKLE